MKYISLLIYNWRAKITSRRSSDRRTDHSSIYEARQIEVTVRNCYLTVKYSATCIQDVFTVFRYTIIQYIDLLPRLQALLYKADVHKFPRNLEATMEFRRQ